MKYKRITMIFVFAAALFLLASYYQRGAVGEVQNDTEENSLVWRIAAPFGEISYAQKLIDVWQNPLNQLLKEKGAGYSVQIVPVGTADIMSEKAAQIADELEELRKADEQTDVISLRIPTEKENLAGYYSVYPECVKRGLLMSLDSVLESEKGARLCRSVTQRDLKRAKVNGVIYGISPAFPVMNAVLYSKEQMDLYGINESELIGSVFEQEEILQRIKNESGKVPYGILTGDFRYKLGMWVLRPCMNVVLGKDGSFVNVTETEEFRNYFARLVDWKKKGLLEVVYDDSRQKSDGIYLVQDGEAANCLIQNDQVFETVLQVFERNGTQQDAKVVAVPNEEAPLLDPYQGEHQMCIASWTEKREMAELSTLYKKDTECKCIMNVANQTTLNGLLFFCGLFSNPITKAKMIRTNIPAKYNWCSKIIRIRQNAIFYGVMSTAISPLFRTALFIKRRILGR